MSFEADNVDHEVTAEALLSEILHQLRLLNARIEEAYETKIEEEDI